MGCCVSSPEAIPATTAARPAHATPAGASEEIFMLRSPQIGKVTPCHSAHQLTFLPGFIPDGTSPTTAKVKAAASLMRSAASAEECEAKTDGMMKAVKARPGPFTNGVAHVSSVNFTVDSPSEAAKVRIIVSMDETQNAAHCCRKGTSPQQPHPSSHVEAKPLTPRNSQSPSTGQSPADSRQNRHQVAQEGCAGPRTPQPTSKPPRAPRRKPTPFEMPELYILDPGVSRPVSPSRVRLFSQVVQRTAERNASDSEFSDSEDGCEDATSRRQMKHRAKSWSHVYRLTPSQLEDVAHLQMKNLSWSMREGAKSPSPIRSGVFSRLCQLIVSKRRANLDISQDISALHEAQLALYSPEKGSQDRTGDVQN